MRTHVYIYIIVLFRSSRSSQKKVLSSETMSNKARQLELDTHSDFYLVLATLTMSVGKKIFAAICSSIAFESSQSREEISR